MVWRKQHTRKPTKKITSNHSWLTQQSALITFQRWKLDSRRPPKSFLWPSLNGNFELVMNLLFCRTLFSHVLWQCIVHGGIIYHVANLLLQRGKIMGIWKTIPVKALPFTPYIKEDFNQQLWYILYRGITSQDTKGILCKKIYNRFTRTLWKIDIKVVKASQL
jgi:hypothetical protein